MKKRTLILDRETLTSPLTSAPAGGEWSGGNFAVHLSCEAVEFLVWALVRETAEAYSYGDQNCDKTQKCLSGATDCATCFECWSGWAPGEAAPACQ